jgi:hypothetical protein
MRTANFFNSLTHSFLFFRALKWLVHPPTGCCFAKSYLQLLSNEDVSLDLRYDILELSRFLTELSVIDYYFVIHRPSVVGLAALLNSMEELPSCSAASRVTLIQAVQKITSLNALSPEVIDCRNRLRLLYAQGGYSIPVAVPQETRCETISPVSVIPQQHFAVGPTQKATASELVGHHQADGSSASL